ncbi:MAG: AMP-binding protein [Crocinitomicaceae bacterium]|tara:strand:+ start:6594 stop:7634 length:1041 start_codon:yes stop_codon:yes gene_type:complete
MININPDFKITYHSLEQKESIEAFTKELKNEAGYISCQTSGSTGKPKEIQISKKALVVSAQNSIDFFELKNNQNAALCLSIDFIAGKMMLVRSLITGMHLHIYPVSTDLSNYLNQDIDFIALVPLQLDQLLAHEKGAPYLKNINKILVGGAAISKTTEELLVHKELTVFQSYGMTETVTHVAIKKTGFQGEAIFRSLAGVRFETNENRLRIIYPGISDHPIQTNDLVHLEDQNSFQWLGRADFVINSGGIKISPEQLEKKLHQIFNFELMVIGIDDAKLGQKVGLIIKGETSEYPIEKSIFKDLIHPFETPKSYTFINDFEKTLNGKLDRNKTAVKTKGLVWKNIL